ncbi:MAG: ABC transporter ATP-binding protein [Zetaproteobacteria bacterium]|nr:MAG: ABC transporter ATP-binding protein [Zetaproteobacteria bacterium]
MVAFLGPNGGGKTTTMRMLAGILRPDRGRCTVLGRDVLRDPWAVRRSIGYMSQAFSLYQDLTVRENLLFAARAYGVGDPEATCRAMLARFALEPFADRLAGALSGGLRQRLALACALQHAPRLLLLDEPTSGVDPATRRLFWRTILEETARGAAALVSTHYLDEAEQYADRIVYLAEGQLLVDGTLAQVIEASGLVSVRVRGAPPEALERLEADARVWYLARTAEGAVLAGGDLEALMEAVRAHLGDAAAEPMRPRLEEVFLHLWRRAKEQA